MEGRGKPAKLRVRGDTFGYLQRSFPTIISESDAYEARECGRRAVDYALTAPGGLNSGSVAMKRTSDSPYQIDFFATALSSVARQTKHLPVEWVVNGNDLSAEYIKYATPLWGGCPGRGSYFELSARRRNTKGRRERRPIGGRCDRGHEAVGIREIKESPGRGFEDYREILRRPLGEPRDSMRSMLRRSRTS